MLLKFVKSREFFLFMFIVVFSLAITVVIPNFLTVENFADLLKSFTVLGIFSLGVLIVLLSGGFDLSFTAIAQVAQYVVVYFFVEYEVDNVFFAIIATMVIGALLGLVNGVIIYYYHITAIIVTIATNSIYIGFLYVITEGELLYDIPESFSFLSDTKIFPMVNASGAEVGICVGTAFWFLLCILVHLFIKHTVLGRSIVAIGGNQLSASRVGFNICRTTLFIYTFVGAMAGFASLIQCAVFQSVVPNSMVGHEMEVIAAVVLGGASVTGGRGTVLGTFLGVLLFAVLSNGLTLMKISPFFYQIFTGIVILLSVSVNALQDLHRKHSQVRVQVKED